MPDKEYVGGFGPRPLFPDPMTPEQSSQDLRFTVDPPSSPLRQTDRPNAPAPHGPSATGFEQYQPGEGPLTRFSVGAAPLGMGLAGSLIGGSVLGAGLAGATKGVLSKSPAKGALEAGGWLGGSALGKTLGSVAGWATKGQALEKMSEAIEKKAVNLLHQKVPAWKDFSTLTEMFHGQNALSAAYDVSLKAVMEKGAQRTVTVPAHVASELGLFGKGAKELADLPIPVNAAELARAMTGKWKEAANAYRQAAEALDKAGIGDPKARAAYRWGTGAIDYLHATQGLIGEKLNLDKVMAGLMDKKKWNILRIRGMEEFANTLRGSGATPITHGVVSPLTKGAAGIAGFLAGMPTGHPFPAYYAGKAAAEAGGKLKGTIPELPWVQVLRQAGKLGGPLGAAGVEGVTP